MPQCKVESYYGNESDCHPYAVYEIELFQTSASRRLYISRKQLILTQNARTSMASCSCCLKSNPHSLSYNGCSSHSERYNRTLKNQEPSFLYILKKKGQLHQAVLKYQVFCQLPCTTPHSHSLLCVAFPILNLKRGKEELTFRMCIKMSSHIRRKNVASEIASKEENHTLMLT